MRGALLALPLGLLAVPAFAEPAAAPAPAPAPVAAMLGTGLRVSDLERSIRFYTDVLGMRVAMRLPHGTLTEVMIGFGGRPALILMKDSDPAKSPPIALGTGFEKIVLDMPDLAAVTARLKAAGLPVGEVHESTGVKVLFVTDPDGYRYELIQRSRAAATKE